MKTDKEFLVKGSLVNGLGLVTRAVSPALVILLARFYPQTELGLYISFQALVLTLSRAAVLGLDKGLMWYIPRRERLGETSDHGLADSLLASMALGVLLFALFAIAGWTGLLSRFDTLKAMPLPFMLLMVGAVLPYTAVQLFSGALEGKRLPQYRVFISLFLTTSLVPILALLLKYVLGDAMSLAAGMFFGNLAGCLFFIPVLRARFPDEAWAKAGRPPAELLAYSLPLAGTELVYSLASRVDVWMILLLLGPEKVAVYAVMVTITNGLRTVRQTFDPLLIPIVSNLSGDELGLKLKASFSYATNMVSTIQLFIACFILVFPREILSLAGKAYAIEVFAFALLLMSNLFNGFLGLNGLVVLGMGKSKFNFNVSVIALAFSAVCNWILIPKLGIVGAALTSCLNLLGQNLAQFVYIRFTRKLELYEPHLYINAALELLFVALFFLAYRWIEALSLLMRMEFFAAIVLGLLGMVWLKRKSYRLN